MFNKNKRKKDGYSYECKKCHALYMKEYSKRDKAKKQRNKRYAELDGKIKAKRAERVKEWRNKNRERLNEYDKERYKNNKHVYIQRVAKRKADMINATPSWADIKAIESIYKQAKYMKCKTGTEYHVDHIVPLKGKLVCGLHVENNLQILTSVENRSKSNNFNV